jgi:hypothetical protein
MKKTILIILILCAIPLYTYNIFLLIRTKTVSNLQKNKENPAGFFDKWLIQASAVEFKKSGRSPFSPFKEPPPSPLKPVVVTDKFTKKNMQKKVEIPLPAIQISGIMWSPTNPVAMITFPGGTSEVVKEGGTYSDFIVKKIERHRIQILFNKQLIWIDK